MIPIRVKVQGFLSYRDEATLEFDGVALWMLAGPNGAGKSAVFDAVTFALYGAHRGGKQNADRLINQSRDKLLVEFDFRLGEDIYRAKRTESRRSQPTRQIIHLSGPNAPQGKRGGESVVPETESKTGFDAWVKEHIGLSYEAFKASVLLRQGESDALLKMDSRERHDLLTQLVDMSDYVHLYDRAKGKLDEFSAQEKLLAQQLEQLPTVSRETIDALVKTIKENQGISEQAQVELQQIAALKAHADHWQKRKLELARTDTELIGARSLLEKSAEIEQAAQRFDELNRVLPILQRLLDARRRSDQARTTIADCLANLTRLTGERQIAESERDALRQNIESRRKEQETKNLALQQAQSELIQLKPAQQDLARLVELRPQVEELDSELSAFPITLDEQVNQAQETIEKLTELKTVLANLRQIYSSQQDRAQAINDAENWDTTKTKLEEQIQQLRRELAARRKEEESLSQAQTQSDTTLARATAEFDATQTRLTNLETLTKETTCIYCGQPLTPAHLRKERQRLTGALAETQAIVDNARTVRDEAKRQATQLTRAIRKLEERIQTTKENIVEARQTAQERRRAAQDARKRIQDVLAALPKDVRARVTDAYPSEADLKAMDSEIGNLKSIRERHTRLSKRMQDRDHKIAERKPLAKELNRLLAAYPDERIQTVRLQIQQAENTIQDLQVNLRKLTPELEALDTSWYAADQNVLALQTKISEYQSKSAVAEEQQKRAQTDETREIDSLPDGWHTYASDVTEPALQALQDEHKQLQGSDQKLEELNHARRAETQLLRDSKRLSEEISGIPLEAQHEPEHFESLSLQVQSRQQQAEQIARAADGKRITLEANLTEHRRIEREYLEAARLTHRYRTLANLLGRDGLQRHLLEQVERAIVNNANAVLDRISGGSLWLELQGDAGASKTKALDLVAYNRANGANSIAVDYLSGSQRFRTAVSLALGIGQYASQESRRVEAVIIDEGFGSLDKAGLQEMIDELHNLKDTLSRIIVVSHQDEFARAFPNRYAIRIQDGSSIAGLETGDN